MSGLFAELTGLGCENTVLGVRGSSVSATLVPVVDEPMYEHTASGAAWEYGPYEQHQLLTAITMASEFDVVHSHIGWGGWCLSGVAELADRVLHTQHNPVSPDMAWFIVRHPDLLLSTVSEYQARKLRELGAERCHVVHNGLDFTQFPLQSGDKEGLVYLGRIEHEKGTDVAIDVARSLGMSLTIAGPAVNHEYFDREIAPRLDDDVRYVGVVGQAEKVRLLGGAACVLMPSRDEEGFGLVALESMACGTPVVALARGALPEVVEEGIAGFTAAEERALAGLVSRAMTLEPAAVRASAERRFSVSASAADYISLYETVASASRPRT